MSSIKYTISNNFSDRLKLLIKSKLGLSQKAFSEETGIAESFLSNVIKGRSGPSADMIASIYLHYSEYLDWLLTGEQKTAVGGEGRGVAGSCPVCGSWSDELRQGCEALKEILDSGDDITKGAILSNLLAFRKSVHKDHEIDGLKEDVKKLKKGLRELHSDSQQRTGKSARKAER